MKVALISDQHFGLADGSERFHDNFELFYKNIFFPELLKRKITKVYHLGDVFHNRKKIDTSTIQKARDYFFDPLAKNDIEISIIVGNHDIYYRETNRVNSPSLILKSYSNAKIYQQPAEEDNIALLPWINKSNAEEVYNFIKNTKCNVLMGHLELKGFKFNKKQVAEHGMGTKIFEKFDKVLSGHYHTRSKKGNIEYIGAPTQHTWIDDGDMKGFYIFDTETLEMDFIENPHNMYHSFIYSDDMNVEKEIEKCENRMVKVLFNKIENYGKYNDMLHEINKVAYDIKNTDLSSFTTDIDSETIDVEDTSDIIKNYILELSDIDHEKVYSIMNNLYNEALTN